MAKARRQGPPTFMRAVADLCAVRDVLPRMRHDREVGWSEAELQRRIEEVTVDAYGDDEQLESFACVLDELLERPLPATVLGAPVEVLSVQTGGYRQGLRARCRRAGQQWEVTLVDVAFGPDVDPELALTLAAYRRWLGDDE